jgi:hypothetical protein
LTIPSEERGRTQNEVGSRHAAQNPCLICSRVGAAFMPENRPLPIYPQLNCEDTQAVNVSISLEINSNTCVGFQDCLKTDVVTNLLFQNFMNVKQQSNLIIKQFLQSML